MTDYINADRADARLDVGDIPRRRAGLLCPLPGGETLTFDLYYPSEGDGPFPAIISVAGGGWYFGAPSSTHLGSSVHTAVARGYAVVSTACASSGLRKFPYQLLELKGLIRYLRRESGSLNLNPTWFAFWSASSGGHLSLMAALTADLAEFDFPDKADRTPSAAVQAVAAIYPVCRLGNTEEDFRAIGLEPVFDRSGPRCMDSILLDCPVEHNPERSQWASPCSYVTKDAPPLLLLHGMADRVVPYSDSVRFAEDYRAAVGADRVVFCCVPGVGHSCPTFKLPPVNHLILDFFDRVRLGQPLRSGELERALAEAAVPEELEE